MVFVISNVYDNADRQLILANLGPGGSTLSSFAYSYNAVNNRTQVIEADGSVVTWSYDPTYQLTNEKRSGATAYNITYVYDGVGNRTLMVNSGAATTYAYNAADELTTSQTGAGVTTYTFDGDGNLLTTLAPGNQLTTNTWDGENRLANAVLSSGIVNTFTYSADGRRIAKQDSTGTAKNIWDGQCVLLETNASGIIQAVNSLEPAQYGKLISQARGGAELFYSFDVLGSTRLLSDNAGVESDTYIYDAFGNELSTTGASVNWFRYIGRSGYLYDPDLAKYHARATVYDPVTGRFLSSNFVRRTRLASDYRYAANYPAGPDVLKNKPAFSPPRLIRTDSLALFCPGLGKAIAAVNEVVRSGRCKAWFEEHAEKLDTPRSPIERAPSGTTTFGISLIGGVLACEICLFAPMFTIASTNVIVVCPHACFYSPRKLAELLLHELAHHYCGGSIVQPQEREDCAHGAQNICAGQLDELLGEYPLD